MVRRWWAVAAALVVTLGLSGCIQGPDGVGTRDEPTPVGAATSIGTYEIAFFTTNFDADAVVAAEDVANQPPAPGRRFVLVPLQLTYLGTTLGEPWLDLDVRYVTRTGAMYGELASDQCGTVPGSLEYVDQMPPETTAWGTICVSVPVDEVEGGVWVAREGDYWGWYGFFAASADAATVPGSFVAPVPVGAPVEVGGYSVVFGSTRAGDAAAADRTAVLAPVTVTFHGGPSSGHPWGDLSFTFVTADGTTYGRSEEDRCADIPDALEYIGVLELELPVAANVCVSVPAEQVDGGRWHVTPEGSKLVATGYAALS